MGQTWLRNIEFFGCFSKTPIIRNRRHITHLLNIHPKTTFLPSFFPIIPFYLLICEPLLHFHLIAFIYRATQLMSDQATSHPLLICIRQLDIVKFALPLAKISLHPIFAVVGKHTNFFEASQAAS